MNQTMELTTQFLRSKSPCAMGFRWYLRNLENGVGYQKALDALVAAGRVDDAVWLLENFGPTTAVLELEQMVRLLRTGEKKAEPAGRLTGPVTPENWAKTLQPLIQRLQTAD